MSPTTSKGEPNLSGNAASKSEPRHRTIAVVDNHIDSRDVFVGTREIIIVHGDDQYRLRLTSQNKLILTK